MTRSPLRSPDVEGVEGEPYELNPVCAAPGCMQPSDDPHHLFRRSALGGPFWWVQLAPGLTTGNVIGLCRKHHSMVTTDAAWISYEDGFYVWSTLFDASVLLDQQPPVRRVQEGVGESSTNGSHDVSAAHVAAEGTCPTCLRPLPHPKREHEPRRERRTWSVTVPKDSREDGADTIDTLLEEGRKELAKAGMPYGDADTAKFFVLTHILALFVQHAEEVMT